MLEQNKRLMNGYEVRHTIEMENGLKNKIKGLKSSGSKVAIQLTQRTTTVNLSILTISDLKIFAYKSCNR